MLLSLPFQNLNSLERENKFSIGLVFNFDSELFSLAKEFLSDKYLENLKTKQPHCNLSKYGTLHVSRTFRRLLFVNTPFAIASLLLF